MAGRSFGDQSKSFGALAKDLTDMRALDAELSRYGQAAANRIAAKTLGADRKHTGKGKGWGVPLDVQARRLRNKDGVLIYPTRSSAGPWTEAERGRNQGDVGVFMGPGANRRTGMTQRTNKGKVRKVREFKARRWNGTTAARGAASEAAAEIEKDVAPVVQKAVIALTRKHLEGQ